MGTKVNKSAENKDINIAKQNPYVDSNYKDISRFVDYLKEGILDDVKTNPDFYAQLVVDYYLNKSHNTFETEKIINVKHYFDNKLANLK